MHLFNDGALYGDELRLVDVAPKVFALPHINAAIGVRGPAMALPLLIHFVGEAATSYDDLKANIAVVLENARSNVLAVLDGCVLGPAFDVVIGGFSATTGPDAYAISCDASGDLSPVTEIPHMGFMPGTVPAVDDFLTVLSFQGGEIEPKDFGLHTMELQRTAYLRGENACPVGGFCQMTTIRKSEIETKVLRRWPDEIGKLVAGKNTNCATSGAIDSLAVKSLNLADQAVTVSVVVTASGPVGSGASGLTVSTVTMSIDTSGLSGKPIWILASWSGAISYTGSGASAAAAMFIDGTQVQNVNSANSQSAFISLTGALSFTGTGGTVTKTVVVTYTSSTTGNPILTQRCLWATGAKR